MERVSRDIDKSHQEGFKRAAQVIRCNELRRKRETIDSAGKSQELKEQRFAIREEQFRLACKRT